MITIMMLVIVVVVRDKQRIDLAYTLPHIIIMQCSLLFLQQGKQVSTSVLHFSLKMPFPVCSRHFV